MYATGDNAGTLDVITMFNLNRPTRWAVEDPKSSHMFSNYPQYLIENVTKLDIAFHVHTYAMNVSFYN